MISKHEIADILAKGDIDVLPDGADEDTELAVDSLTEIKIQMALENKLGIVVESHPDDFDAFSSVRRIHALAQRATQRALPVEER